MYHPESQTQEPTGSVFFGFIFFGMLGHVQNDFEGVQFHGSNQLVLIDSIIADSTQNFDTSGFNGNAVR